MDRGSHLTWKIGGILDYLKVGIWRVDVGELPWTARVAVGTLKILILTIRQLSEERLHLRVAGLTFYSLLSIVPVLAMLFGLAKGFGLDRLLEREILRRGQGQEEVVTKMIGFAHNLLETTQGGVVAGVGVAVLFWSVIKVFGSVEKGFNDVWGVAKDRPLLRKAADYLSLSVLCAVLLSVSSTLTVLITSEVEFAVNRISMLEAVGPAIFAGLKILPLMVIWLLFTLLYTIIPNTRVRVTAAALAGILAGTAYQVFQRIYIHFQIGVSKYNAIYGSFAALPLFLVWLQLSWLIVFVGAYVSHAFQNLDRLTIEQSTNRISHAGRRLLALFLVNRVLRHFCDFGGGLSMKAIAGGVKLPVSILQRLLEDLVACGVLSEVKSPDEDDALYQPGLDPEKITIQMVIELLDRSGSEELPLIASETFVRLTESLDTFRAAVRESPANVLLKNI